MSSLVPWFPYCPLVCRFHRQSQRAFDTSWVEGTLGRLFDAGVRGRVWSFMCNFSQYSWTHGWTLAQLNQGRVLFSTAFQRSSRLCEQFAPGVQFSSSSSRLFQVCGSASFIWKLLWTLSPDGVGSGFSFGTGSTKSAVMVFGQGVLSRLVLST